MGKLKIVIEKAYRVRIENEVGMAVLWRNNDDELELADYYVNTDKKDTAMKDAKTYLRMIKDKVEE